MADDSDLARLLPDPPPPRPAARDAALAAAMRRFDGVPDPTPAAAPDRPPRRRVSGKQIGAFATIVLVAGISLSIALNRPGGLHPGTVEQPTAVVASRSAPASGSTSTANQPGTSTAPVTSNSAASTGLEPVAKPGQATPKPIAPAVPVILANGADDRASTDQVPSASLAPAPPPPTSPPAPEPPAMRYAARGEPSSAASDERSIVVTGSRVQQKMADSASAVSVVSGKAVDDTRDVVVTGVRRGRADPYAARGDWNACTVTDPEQSLRGCRRLIGIGAKGPAGEAATRLSDGLALAWRGDWAGAIAAFDQAIALKPKFAFAYLNRGLAYQREGDSKRAAVDLDLAIKYAPFAARGYYNRGVLRRENGDRRGADADADRAVELGSDYPDPAQ